MDFFSSLQSASDNLSKVTAECQAAKKEGDMVSAQLARAASYEEEVRAYLQSSRAHNAGLASLAQIAQDSVVSLHSQLEEVRAETKRLSDEHQKARQAVEKTRENFCRDSKAMHQMLLHMQEVTRWTSAMDETTLERQARGYAQELAALEEAERTTAHLEAEHEALVAMWDSQVELALAE